MIKFYSSELKKFFDDADKAEKAEKAYKEMIEAKDSRQEELNDCFKDLITLIRAYEDDFDEVPVVEYNTDDGIHISYYWNHRGFYK